MYHCLFSHSNRVRGYNYGKVHMKTLCAHEHNQKQKQTIINYWRVWWFGKIFYCWIKSVLSVRNEAEQKRYNLKAHRWLSLSEKHFGKNYRKRRMIEQKKKQQQPLSFTFIVFNCLAEEFLSQYISGVYNMYYLQLIYPSLLHSIADSVFESILIRSLLSFASAISSLNCKSFPLALDTTR